MDSAGHEYELVLHYYKITIAVIVLGFSVFRLARDLLRLVRQRPDPAEPNSGPKTQDPMTKIALREAREGAIISIAMAISGVAVLLILRWLIWIADHLAPPGNPP